MKTNWWKTDAGKQEGSDQAGRRSGSAGRDVARRAGVVALFVALSVVGSSSLAWAAPGGIGEVQRFASRLTNYVTAIAASVAVLFMSVNGVRWTMSSGNPARQAEAKAGLVSAAAGLAIALSANLVVNLVVAALR